MAYMWISDANQKWEAVALSEEAYDLRNFPSLPRTFVQAAVVMKIADGAPGTWAVMAGCKGEVYLNGHPIIAGLAILADRDEIRINGSTPLFFSTETLASVQALPGADRPIFCGRCRQQMKPGCPAVQCPRCRVWYDQSAEIPCWIYGDKCTFCGQPTALDAGFEWTPEE